MADMNPLGILCVSCGKVAAGWAFIEGRRFCYGMTRPSCFDSAFEDEWTLDMVQRGFEVLTPSPSRSVPVR